MKKFLIAALSAVLVIVLCAPVSAGVINSNHYIDYQRFNDDESEWEVYGWTVVDTEIVRIGYVLDGMEFVWVVDEVDSRSNANNMAPNDCFFDDELYAAIASMGLANGLTDYYSYRIHITLDTLAMEKGDHMIEVAAEYSDGSLGNPFRNNTIEFTKTKDAVIPEESSEEETTEPEETEPDVTEPEESSEPDDTEEIVEPADKRGDFNGDGEVDNKDVVTLFRYISANSESTDPIYDFNDDGGVNNKDVVSLFRAVSAN